MSTERKNLGECWQGLNLWVIRDRTGIIAFLRDADFANEFVHKTGLIPILQPVDVTMYSAKYTDPYEKDSRRVSDTVNHPSHYGGDTVYEAIKVIEAWELGFNLGNAVKYVSRADRKGTAVEDLKKARWYLDREIARREAAK
jgi:hypothetical protein